MTPLRRRMTEDMILRNRTPGTIQRYVGCFVGFARHFNTSPELLGPRQVRSYLLHLGQKRLRTGKTAAWATCSKNEMSHRFESTATRNYLRPFLAVL
jgi:Phage integrase, N-terminal SAM-like domain